MAAAVSVNFRVGGVADVHQAFRSVEQSTLRAERAMKKMYDDDVRAAKKAADTKEKDYAKLLKWEERERQKAAKDTEKLLMSEAKAADKATAEKIKADEAWAKQRQRIMENSAKLAYRIAEKEVRDAEQLEKQKADARERWARGMGRTIGGSLTSLASTAMNVGGSVLALGGGFGVADAVQRKFALEHEAALFSNQSSTSAGGRVSTKAVMDRARAVGLASNMDPTEIARAMSASFAKTGDAQSAMSNIGLYAQLAKATGSDVSQIASVAGALKVQNNGMTDAQQRAMLLNIVGQTRKGAVDVSDLVQHVPTITSTSSQYAGDQTVNQGKLIGLSQVAMRTSGSSAEAATAVERFTADISQHAGKIQAAGVDVKDANGGLKSPAEIIAALMQKTGGDVGKLHDLGIGKESMRLFTAETANFKSGGADAVKKDIESFENGGYTEKSLAADFSNTMATSSERFKAATEKVAAILEDKLTPYLERFADKLPEIMPKVEAAIDAFDKVANAFIDHPILGVGAVIVASVTKDIAAAQVGNLIGASISKAIEASGSGGKMSFAVQSMAVAAASVAMYEAGKTAIDQHYDAQDKSRGDMLAISNDAGNLVQKLNAGTATEEDRQHATQLLTDLKAKQRTAASGAMLSNESTMDKVFGGLAGSDAVQSKAAADTMLLQQLLTAQKDLKTALDRNTTATEKDAKNQGSNPGNPNRNEPISSTPRGGSK